jgi:tetratricopeptide (TPR) repeat protein
MKILLALFLAGAALFAQAPVQFDGHKAKIRELLQEKKYEAALAEARGLNQKFPDDIASYQFLVDAHLGLGQKKEAERAAQWMLDLRLGKADAQGWWRVAKVRAAYGEVDDALAAMAQALRIARLDNDPEIQSMTVYTNELKARQAN